MKYTQIIGSLVETDTTLDQIRQLRPVGKGLTTESIVAYNNLILPYVFCSDSEEQRAEAFMEILDVNEKLIRMYVYDTNFKCYPYCEYEDAESIFRILLFEKLIEGKIVDWEEDYLTVFMKVRDEAKKKIHAEYCNTKMSYTTRMRKLKAGTLNEEVCELTDDVIGNHIDLEPTAEDHCFIDALKRVVNDGLVDALKTVITKEEFELFIARALYDVDYKEIAEGLGISAAACKMRYFRILNKLRGFFEEMYPEAHSYVL